VIPKRRWRLAAAVAGALLVFLAVVVGLFVERQETTLPPRPAGERPQLLLLTSLPLLFPEQLELDSKPAPVLSALRSRYTIAPISVADRASLDHHRLLLMAQPQAQPAEVLVELDEWVRGGGRVLLLADPALEWPSRRPLGSLLRPPLAFPDTGLLGHWGLRLDAPDSLGPKTIEVGGSKIRTASPGMFVSTGSNCSVESGFVARCRIGGGEATVIADADFINSPGSNSANLALLLAELDRLER
jgi:hypothetical protein